MPAHLESSPLIIIPARGGSRGVPGKNLLEVGGVSLVGRAIIAAQGFVHSRGLSARIVVDTDSEPIADEGRRWGADVPFLRPAVLARDTTQTVDNVLHFIDRLGPSAPTDILLLQPTSPLRQASDVDCTWAAYERTRRTSAVSIVAIDHPIALSMVRGDDGVLRWPASEPESTRRQDHPEYYRPNGAVYAVSTELLRSTRRFLIAGTTYGALMPASRSVDVDTAEDLAVARSLAFSTPALPLRQHNDGQPPVLMSREQLSGCITTSTDEPLEGILRLLADPTLQSPVTVRLGPYDSAEEAERGLGLVVPLRSALQVATVWVSSALRPWDTIAAASLGVSAIVPPDTVDRDGLLATARLIAAHRNRLSIPST